MPLCPLRMACLPSLPCRLYSSHPSYQSRALLEGPRVGNDQNAHLASLFLSLLQASEGDLRATESAEAGDRGPVPPPRQAAAPQLRPLPHGPTHRPPEKDQQEQAEGGEVAEPPGAAAQGRGLQHRLAQGPPSHPQTWEPGRWEAGTRPWKSASCISSHWSKEASSGLRAPRPPPLLSSALLPAECCPGWGLLPPIPFPRCMSAPDSGG